MKTFLALLFIPLGFACCDLRKDCPKPTSHSITLSGSLDKGNEVTGLKKGEDTYVASYSPDVNYGTDQKIYASAWTYSGAPSHIYSLIQFDYSGIPANAEITSAYLSLYANTTNEFPGSPSPISGHFGGGNDSSYLKRVTSSWEELTVTWNTKPTETNSNMINLAPTTSNSEDFLEINVTKIVQDQIKYGNYGFEFGFLTYIPYKRVVFNSFEVTNSAVRPKLVINYK